MSIQAVASAIDLPDEIGSTKKLILILLANAFNGHTRICFPSQERLAKEAGGLDIKTIQRNLRELERDGYIFRNTVHKGRGQGSETHYELLFLQGANSPLQQVRPRADVPIDPALTSLRPRADEGCLKDKPEYNRNNKPEGREKIVFDFYNDIARKAGWVVHSKLSQGLRKPLNARINEYGVERVKQFFTAMSGLEWTYRGFDSQRDFRASLTYLCRPATFAKHFDKLVTTANVKAEQKTSSDDVLDSLFEHFALTGEWHGGPRGFMYQPDSKSADYPADLYVKHKLVDPRAVLL